MLEGVKKQKSAKKQQNGLFVTVNSKAPSDPPHPLTRMICELKQGLRLTGIFNIITI